MEVIIKYASADELTHIKPVIKFKAEHVEYLPNGMTAFVLNDNTVKLIPTHVVDEIIIKP